MASAPVVAALFVAALTTAGVTRAAWSNRSRPASKALAGVMGVAALWSATALGSAAVGGGVLWGKLLFLFVPLVLFPWIAFAAHYTGRSDLLTGRNVLLLSLHPVVMTVAVLTNGMSELVWTDVSTWTRGPLWYLHAAYSYGALTVTTAAVVRGVLDRDREEVFRGQGVAVALAVLAPIAANALYVAGPVTGDVTPVGFAVSGVALLWGMHEYGLTEVAPVARRTLVEGFQDGVIVVDADGRVTEVNDEAVEMLDLSRPVVGEYTADVFSHVPAFHQRYVAGDVPPATDAIEVGLDRRTFDVTVTPLEKADSRVGRLVTVHDVTEQKRRERELERQNRQLDQFASLVSHEVGEPLAEVEAAIDEAADRVDPETRGDLVRARQSVAEVEAIVEDVRALARQGGAVEREDTALVSLANVADRAWYEATGREGLATLDVEDRQLRADPDRLERLLANLFENAVEFGGREVIVQVGEIDGDESGFYVQDDGPGVPEGARDAVFRAGVSGREDAPGLGLAIVETMADAHGWSVSVTDSPRGGARIEVTGVTAPDEEPEGRLFEPAVDGD